MGDRRERRARAVALGFDLAGAAVLVGVLLAGLAGCGPRRTANVSESPAERPPEVTRAPLAEPSIFEGAGSSLVPLAPTRVRRRVEDLTLRRQGNVWSVEAVSLFRSGPVAETVPVGLPDFEGVTDQGSRRSTLSDVSLMVDGVEIAPALEPPPVAADLGSPGGIGRIYSWQLRFAPDEEKVVRLRFRVRASRTRQGDELLFYYLNTGTPWFGESGRINLRAELGERTARDLVLGWLRPTQFGLRPRAVIWQLREQEPENDLVLAVRPFGDPLADFEDRSLGLLALTAEEMELQLDRSTPEEWSFWRAFLQVRRGEPPPEGEIGELLAAEDWYRPNDPDERPRAMTPAEDRLFEMLTRRLREFESMQLPSPQELRTASPEG